MNRTQHRRGGFAALASVVLVGLAGCAQGGGEAPAQAAAVAPAPSREARLAVTRCAQTLDGISTSSAGLLAAVTAREADPPPAEIADWDSGEVVDGMQIAELRRQAERAVTDAAALCSEAKTQLSADGLDDATAQLGDFLGHVTALNAALYQGTRGSLAGPAGYFSVGGQAEQWTREFEQSLGM